MDEDELAEIRGATSVQPTADFDTFGSAAAEEEKRRARADAAESGSQAPSLTSGPIIEVLLAPVAESLGRILYNSIFLIINHLVIAEALLHSDVVVPMHDSDLLGMIVTS